MKLFSLGPVEMYDETMKVYDGTLPYFRTHEFSKVNLNVTKLLKKMSYTDESSEVAILTSSGSGAMEAAVINVFNEKSKVLIVNGGTFGNRFCEICKVYNIPYTDIKLNFGETLKEEHLKEFRGEGFDGLLINANETSTGVYYDLDMVGRFCKEEGSLFIVDAISSFLADEYYMDKWNIDITVLSSQKALALAPGLSFLIINARAQNIICKNNPKTFYFNLKTYMENIKRGQTPFTPAVGIVLELQERLTMVSEIGLGYMVKNTHNIASDFRKKIKGLPLKIYSEKLSNALTPLELTDNSISAFDIFLELKDNYNIMVCPNGGDLRDKVFRVGHMGNLTIEDNDVLVQALTEIFKKNKFKVGV